MTGVGFARRILWRSACAHPAGAIFWTQV